MGECSASSICTYAEGAVVWCFISVNSRVVLYNSYTPDSMYLASLVSCSVCFKMCICMVVKFNGLRFMSPWGRGVRPGGPSLGQCGELLSTGSPPLPPWRPTFPGLSITLEGWGEGVAWPTLPPYYTDYSVARFLPEFTGVRVVYQGNPR